MREEKYKLLNKLLEEVNELQGAEALLNDVWMWIICDNKVKVPIELKIKLDRYFGFDDSE